MAFENAPVEGEKATDFVVVDHAGAKRRLSDLYAESPLVLLFYRGDW